MNENLASKISHLIDFTCHIFSLENRSISMSRFDEIDQNIVKDNSSFVSIFHFNSYSDSKTSLEFIEKESQSTQSK